MSVPFKTMVQLGKLAREVRKSHGLTQADVALSAGVGIRLVVDMEKGKPTAQIGKVLHILQTLGIKLSAEPPSLKMIRHDQA